MKIIRKRMSLDAKRSNVGYLFILPWLIGILLFVISPLVQSFVYIFNKLELVVGGLKMTFVGFDNISYAFTVDPDFLKKMFDSFITLIWQVPMILIFSTFFGVILNQNFKGRTIARAIMFLPVIVASGLVMSIINGDFIAQSLLTGEKSSSMFNVNIIQQFLFKTGLNLDLVNYLVSLTSNIFEIAWKSGIQILLTMAAMQGVPKTLYEASSIEGANAWESFWKITFPMITPILMINIVFSIVDSFTDVSSSVMSYIASIQARLWLEYASTLSWIYSLLVFIVVGIIFAILKRKVNYTEY